MNLADEHDAGLDGRTTEMPALTGRDADTTSAVLRVSRRGGGPVQRERDDDEPRFPPPPVAAPRSPSAPSPRPSGPALTETERLKLRSVTFPTAWRGYDPAAVDAYVTRVGRILTQAGAPPPSQREAVREALERVGERTTDILREAQEAAERMTAEAEREASERLERADREATQITTSARARLREMDNDIERLWQERERLIADTRQLSSALDDIADQAQARFPAAAPEGPPQKDAEDADQPRSDGPVAADTDASADAEAGAAADSASDSASAEPAQPPAD